MSNTQTSKDDSSSMTVSEYVAIGICSVLLGLIYIASVFLYLHIRKRNRTKSTLELSENINQDPISLSEEGIIKNNPLLGLSGHFQPPGSEGTRSDDDGHSDIIRKENRIIKVSKIKIIFVEA